MELTETLEIKKYLIENELQIYPTQDVPEDLPNIIWDGDNWKDFLKIAIFEQASIIFVREEIFKDAHIISNIIPTTDSDEKIVEFNNKIRSFDKYIGKLAIFTMYWIKNDIVYSFTQSSQWAEDFLNISVMLENTEDREILGM
ncbi:hypothetical protein [Methanococcus maripaludis]|uniref:Uncharacterized protein n=4 Tax=Methanococcus maripaludis TaxID=39152 RepID=Q6LYS8_METMP|nr:hypothetical protein [Methanococcus maripaludis]MBA2846797.1 hypothetical protein [Methanococcus maripaludis]MBA2850689.1 hypothetical protein [Methanococcus maripaludis]MBA2858124.1 hypothetical protein [Methanococcus maripaludis]MBG0768485.1 hypothetical protein [Methanococcus maripaludis]MBM7408942.1 hypothetical protein [Methanococcus maripaludis]